MKRNLLILLMICTWLVSTLTVSANTATPYAYKTKTVSQSKDKSLNTNGYSCKINYNISGNYVYDVNSGAITSAYNGNVSMPVFKTAPTTSNYPNPDFWKLKIEDIQVGTPIIAPGGASVKFPVSFKVKASYREGGIFEVITVNYGVVQDYAIAYAE